ncbi:MAG: PaaX family transcriptional regulator [Deltaproteobacteria bacterium]|nr:MAG: PaaX family transcriptional regulator [Deltaproteobacteria bacterium]
MRVIFAAMQPSAKSFLLDLLSTLRRGTMPVGALVEAAQLFGIAENSTRVALTRLLAAGRVERDARGRYRLGEAARPVGRWVSSWRDLERRERRWNGSWVGVMDGEGAARNARRDRRRRDRALRFLGFRSLAPGLSVRPDNLRGGVAALRAELGGLGLRPGDLVFVLRDLDPVTEARARGLWDIDALHAAHRALRTEVERSDRRFDRLSVEAAMRESFLLGGQVIRQLLLDPRLPAAIDPGEERRSLLEALRRYDTRGRSAWAAFLARFGVPHLRAPADTRMGAGAERLAR